MPTRDRPEPPAELDSNARDALERLEGRPPDELRAIGRYLEELAAWRESTDPESGTLDGSRDGNEDGDVTDEADDLEYPEDVPERAAVTVKEIAGTTYYYYQWRDGDRIESKTVER